MKRVKLEHDKKLVFLVVQDQVTGESITVQLDYREAQNLGEGLFRAGRYVEDAVVPQKPLQP